MKYPCPADVARRLELVGGTNRFGEPMFRVIWGEDRLTHVHGEWEDWKTIELPNGKKHIYKSGSVIETRLVPKYMPVEAWHLEKWVAPEQYGSPENWGKMGQEVVGSYTLDTAGPYPSRGEYELVCPITTDCTRYGQYVPLEGMVVETIVNLLHQDQALTFMQRKAAIEQRLAREEKDNTTRMEEILRSGLRPFHGNPRESVLIGKTKYGGRK